MNRSPLRHFPLYQTRDANAACAFLQSYFDSDFEVTDEAPNRGFTVDKAVLRDITLVYSVASFGFRARVAGSSVVQQRICLSGKGRVTTARGGADIDTRQWSSMSPAGEGGYLEFSPNYAGVRMVVDDSVMRKKLGALMGDASVDHLAFGRETDVRSPALIQYRRLMSFLLSELDADGPCAPSLVIDEIAEALLVSYLLGQNHNFTNQLVRPESTPSRWHQRLAEDYIAQRWNEPLSIEALAKVTNVSARSIFRSFKDTHGCSPFQYVKRVRLHHARAMLLEQNPDMGVISIALKCGFQSLGHFASSYRNEFGELPSQTARR